jgi:hypothetical protein
MLADASTWRGPCTSADMLNFKVAVSALFLASTMAAASPARANCAMPVSYEAAVTANTVVVTPWNFGGGTCPRPGGMLRQNPSSGEIVKLADFCSTPDSGPAAYIDECVPQGTYRYGFAVPYACESSACSTAYFVEASVTTPLDASCARSAENTGPTAATSVPWKDTATICSYQEDPCWDGHCADAGTGGNSGSGGSAANDVKTDSSGCSVGLPVGSAPVLGANVAALLVGLALMRRRRARGA